MKNPFERDPRDRRDPDVEAALRASLDAHASRAPRGENLAEQIIASAGSSERRVVTPLPHRSWGRLTVPAAAAAIVVAIAGITVALVAYDPSPDRPPVAEQHTTRTASPTSTSSSVVVGPQQSTASAATNSSSSIDTSSLHQVRIVDLSFTNTDSGWGLASAQCIDDPAQRCTAIIRTTDGTTWTSHPGDSPFNVDGVSGSAPTVSHIRFATDEIGYVYGSDALFMTTDGGATWQRQKGLGADALETLNGSVLLVRVGNTACPDRCPLTLRSKIGSSTWTPFTLPVAPPNDNGQVTLSRAGKLAVLDVSTVNVAKGLTGIGRVYRSSDDGRTWQLVTGPCPSIGAGYRDDSLVSAIAADSSTVAVACVVRGPNSVVGGSTVTSTDGGRRFAVPSAGGKLGLPSQLAVADAQTQLLVAQGPNGGPSGLYRSTDAGNSWDLVSDVPGDVSFLGFENDRVGRAVASEGTSIWTTRNGGSTWTEVRLP